MKPSPAWSLRRQALGLSLLLLLGSSIGCAKESATPTTTSPEGTSSPGSPASATPAPTSPPKTVPADWHAPNPCSLLTDAEIREVTHFDVNTERRDSRGPDGSNLPNCLSSNRAAGLNGGYVSVTVIPPESSALGDDKEFSAVEEVPGVGKRAVIGHHNLGRGAGSNAALVDMGDGGYLIAVQVLTDVTPEQMRTLVRLAADRWTTK